jgi:hypothetical protein
LQSINHLLQQSRRPSTKKSYNSKVEKFQASHQGRVCACLTAQFAFFSRADSGINLLAEDVDIFTDTFSINVKVKNIECSQAAPLSQVTSATHDPQRLFQQLQISCLP